MKKIGIFKRITIASKLSERGSVAFGVLAISALILEMGAATLYVTSNSMRRATREANNMVLLHLAEAGVQAETDSIWNNFKAIQKFNTIDANTVGASATTIKLPINDTLPSGRFSVGVVSAIQTDTYTRDLTYISVGWIDTNGNGVLNADEPRTTVRTTVRFALSSSKVFDYCYFVNNYGWMNGFSSTDLVVNGDMRANGNFDFSGGTPTINGSVYAAPNDKLIPAATGVVNITPNQWSNSYYATNASTRARQAYNATTHGAKTSATYANWQSVLYDHDASLVNDTVTGAVVGDKNGVKTYGGTVLNPESTTTLPMPDLSDLSRYTALSQGYVDTKTTYKDGTANPYSGQGAYVDVWSSTANAYVRLSTNGVVTGSAKLIGDATHPIKLHGPVTITQDAIVKGTIQGQGTIYTGRNVHIVGSILYSDPPNFSGSNATTIDNANEKKSILGLAARASIIMGDTSTFGSSPLNYMVPPFTKPRYDDLGNYVAAFDAKATDTYGSKKYQSVLGDTYIHSVSSTISQIDAVLYTNFLGGGQLGGSGSGVTFNGSIISKDEAMVLLSLPFKINYDSRIKERALDQKPLVDIELPRTPSITQMNWQEL